MVLAAIAISSKLKADDLYTYMVEILDGLINVNISVASVSCDGTETERRVQHRFVDFCSEQPRGVIIYSIPNPNHVDSAPIKIRVPVYRGNPIMMLQDSKHLAKTFRNNGFSGARSLTLGNYLALFQHFAKLCVGPNAPLYARDFFKLDRQDDNATLRFLSSGALRFLVDEHPDLVGPIIYLFVCGELIDAYQNRKISHDERVHMVMRTRFFFEIWEKVLNATSHPRDRHCISREALDIARIACDGLLGLVSIYRDTSDAEPLLPWLHSTEICEHTFAELRKLMKDFTALDFIYLVPGVEALLRASMENADVLNARARAAGYAHTWCEQRNIDLATLMHFPSQERIADIARLAYEEAASLWDALGVDVESLGDTTSQIRLPSFLSSFPTEDEEDEFDAGVDETRMLDELARHEEALSGIDTDGRLLAASAAILLADERAQVYVATAHSPGRVYHLSFFSESTADRLDLEAPRHLAHERIDGITLARRIRIAAATLPALLIPEEQTLHPFDRSEGSPLDFLQLVAIRELHETDRAKAALRTPRSIEDNTAKELSHRQKLSQGLYDVLRKHKDFNRDRLSTGLSRAVRWVESMTSAGDSKAILLTGNAANARESAVHVANQVFATFL
jgi:hypothetical protein